MKTMASITKSPWIIHYDGSSCNGCDIEVLACLTPMYDVERFGIINTGNPKHADIFLVTGSVNEQNIPVVKQIYNQMPNPKVVVAIGICATSGGIFRDCYNIIGGIDKVIPVDVYVPGCAARPEAIIDGVVKGLGVLAEKQAALAKGIADPTVSGAYRYENGTYDGDGTFLPEEEGDTVIAAAEPQSTDDENGLRVKPAMTEEQEVDD
ncbi:hypothetical protein AGMMS49983_13540 [Clostridia bacterium]|nr:hypothetical protein AGMMS49983_13540 [Clostridia bacterium]